MRGCLGEEWRWHVGPDKAWDAPGWLPARVPGSVLDDLVRAGVAADPYHERDSLLAEWVPERAWLYRRPLTVPPGRTTLRFEGVDHDCSVFVDGRELARHSGMFVPFDVDVSAFADGREHLLAVVVHPAPASVPQVGDTADVRVHKSRMGYGWDFCPRIVHQGVWRPVALVEPREVRHPRVWLDDGAGVVDVDGEVVLRVDEPQLWWPNGLGEQRLYPVTVDGEELHVGFRTVELTPDYTLLVNGRPAPIHGWNWVPVDALYGVPRPEKVAHLLSLARRGNVNLLRVWGGGLIESRELYELCDRLGLLVWQEFSQSSSGIASVPSSDPAFVAAMAAEARRIVPSLRRHPSLAVWCGGNELDADDRTPVLAALRTVVAELDPERAWLPTSPYGSGLDEHGPWEHQGLRRQYEAYDARTCRLHSEFGVEGMTNRLALERLVDAEHRWPADRTNPVYEHLGAWWNNALLVQDAFGGSIGDVETMRRASQWLQYEGLRYAVEATLRRGGGTIPWQLNEPFPNAWCTSAVDWHGVPKPAYWGVARAYRDGHPSARFATCAWGGEAEVRIHVDGAAGARLVNLDGSVAGEGEGEVVAPLEALSEVFVLDLDGRNRYVMTTAATLAPLLALPPARLDVERAGSSLRLRNRGDVAALGVVIEDARPLDEPGWLLLSDNVLDLLPGEEHELELAGADGDLRVEGWNVAVRP